MKYFLPSFLIIFSIFCFSPASGQSNAFDFDGLNDFVTVPNASGLISNSSLSMSCWVYPTNPAAGYPDFDGFLGFRNDFNADFYLLQLNSTTVEARFRNSGGTNFTIAQPGMVLNTWQHYALTYDGSTLSVYLNGVLGGSTPANGNITSSAVDFVMGKLFFNNPDFYLDGRLDDVGLWSKALTPAEVACMYTRGIDPSDANLELYYDFNQGTAGGNNAGLTTVEDRMGNIDGQLTGATLSGTSSNYVAGVDGHTQLTQEICSGTTYNFGGQSLSTTGVYYDVLPVTGACDSIVALSLTVQDTIYGTDNQTACSPFTWLDGNTYTSNNTTAEYLIAGGSNAGCDSVVVLNLTFNSISGTDVRTACDSLLWIDGNTYTSNNTSAQFTIVGGAANGCDSTVNLDLTILNGGSGIDVQVSCDSLLWLDGNTYTTDNNTATYIITSGAGNSCDSTVTLNLSILSPTSGTDVISACDSYTWIDGNTYTTSNSSAQFTISGGAANGCDSIVNLNLTILNSSASIDTVSACDSYTWIDGQVYTTNNSTATDTLFGGAANGCDSIITLNLTITSIDTTVDLTLGQESNLISAETGASYQWLDCANGFSPISGETNVSFTPLVVGSYAVEITKNSCIDTSACVDVLSVGIIENNFSTDVQVYPNPSQGNFTIDLGQNFSALQVEVFTITGQLIQTKRFAQVQSFPISLVGKEAGVYFIRVSDDLNKSARLKVFKE